MKPSGKPLTTIGIVGTIVWALVIAAMLFYQSSKLSGLTLNEWGDFFSGACAPLAFLWLVLGYFQQGIELRQNTSALQQQERALQLQVEELRSSVEQQQNLVELTRQEVESSRMNTEQSRQREKLLAQPVVHTISLKPSMNQQQQKIYVFVDIENAGHNVTEATVEITAGAEHFQIIDQAPKNWVSGTNFRCRAVHSTGLPEGTNGEMVVSYLDGTGERSAKPFTLSINRGGSLTVSERVRGENAVDA